jgi:hypothetical protein
MEVEMETNHVDATVDFVDIDALKQDSRVREGQSDAKPGIGNQTFLHHIGASAVSNAERKQVLPRPPCSRSIRFRQDYLDIEQWKNHERLI